MSVRKLAAKVQEENTLCLKIEIGIVFGEGYPFVFPEDAGVPYAEYSKLEHVDFDEWKRHCVEEDYNYGVWWKSNGVDFRTELKERSYKVIDAKINELRESEEEWQKKLKDMEKKIRTHKFDSFLEQMCRKERQKNRWRIGPLEEEQMRKFPERQELVEKINKIRQEISIEENNTTKLKQKVFEEVIKPKLLELQEKIKEDRILKIHSQTGYGDHVYLYEDALYKFDRDYSDEELLLQILDFEDNERRKFERLKRKFDLSQQVEKAPRRENIPEEVRIAVWRRDEGKCSRCGSRKKLEYDHIIPVSKGGSNTVRNIELLCEECNRRKKDNIQ